MAARPKFSLGDSGPLDETLQHYRVPAKLHAGILSYIVDGVEPGDFLRAVITNSLRDAVGRADFECAAALTTIVRWFYNEAPAACWGSPEKAAAWVENKRAERTAKI